MLWYSPRAGLSPSHFTSMTDLRTLEHQLRKALYNLFYLQDTSSTVYVVNSSVDKHLDAKSLFALSVVITSYLSFALASLFYHSKIKQLRNELHSLKLNHSRTCGTRERPQLRAAGKQKKEFRFQPDKSPFIPRQKEDELLDRLVYGAINEFERVYIPGRGWVSFNKLQNELGVSDDTLDHLLEASHECTPEINIGVNLCKVRREMKSV